MLLVITHKYCIPDNVPVKEDNPSCFSLECNLLLPLNYPLQEEQNILPLRATLPLARVQGDVKRTMTGVFFSPHKLGNKFAIRPFHPGLSHFTNVKLHNCYLCSHRQGRENRRPTESPDKAAIYGWWSSSGLGCVGHKFLLFCLLHLYPGFLTVHSRRKFQEGRSQWQVFSPLVLIG